MKRIKLAIVIQSLFFIIFSLKAQTQPPDTTKFQREEIFLSMLDGAKLATDIYVPKEKDKHSCLLVRTPYNKDGIKGDAEWFANNNFVVVVQDCRGKFKSDGIFYPFRFERNDGLQTVHWIRKQPWSNGKIGGWGGSYVGYTQWAIADSLDALVPNMTGANLYELIYPGGLFSLQTAFNWGLLVDNKTINQIAPEKIFASYWILPLSTADDSTIKDIPFLNDWLAHQTNDEYWQQMDVQQKTCAPVFSIAGWYDIFLTTQIADFEAIAKDGHQDNRLIIGPWCHGPQGFKNEYGGSAQTGKRNEAARAFLLNHLYAKKEIYLLPPFVDKKYNFFIMERNEYLGADEYPPAQMQATNYYLGPALYLKPENYPDSGALQFAYDPSNPYPSKGGTALGIAVGPAVQNDNMTRADQLVFETERLLKPLVLLGPISATLFVASSAPCTDFIVCLQDVFPDSTIINIQEGGTSVNFESDRPQKISFSVWATGYQINPQHKLRVVITSSWFPRFNRQLNNCELIYSAQTISQAEQQVFYGADKASYITLPLINIIN